MKKVLFIMLVILFNSNAIGQVWIDSGAVWHYDYQALGYWGFNRYTYVNDTIINGHTCQKITGEIYGFSYDQYHNIVLSNHNTLKTHFTYASGDTVFYWHHGEFFVLYNFGATIGDKWIIATNHPQVLWDCGNDTSRVEVVDTGRMTLNSVNYRYIKLQPTANSPLGLKGTYVERFGNIDTSFYINNTYMPFQYLFPDIFQCDSLTGMVDWTFIKFKCYQDSSFSLYNPSGQDCEYYFTHLGISETQKVKLLNFSPNPFTHSTQITLPQTYRHVMLEVYNVQGKLMAQYQYADCDKIQLMRNQLGSGLYFLKLTPDDGAVITGKVIVE